MDEVIQAAERAADLTRQMLAYAGKGKFVIGPVDISKLVRDVRIDAGLHFQKIRLVLDLAEHPLIEGDSSQIQQLVWNLVVNAAEALGGSAGTIVVRTGERRLPAARPCSTVPSGSLEPGHYVCLEVEDDGCGMDDRLQSRIFEPFLRPSSLGAGSVSPRSSVSCAARGAI